MRLPLKKLVVICGIGLFTMNAALADPPIQHTLDEWHAIFSKDAKMSNLVAILGKPDLRDGNIYIWRHAVDNGTKDGISLYVLVGKVGSVIDGVDIIGAYGTAEDDAHLMALPWFDSLH